MNSNQLASTATIQYMMENFEAIQKKIDALQLNSQVIINRLDFIVNLLVNEVGTIKKEDREIEEKLLLISSKIEKALINDSRYEEDLDSYTTLAQGKIKNWDLLDDSTRKLLISAEYLYSMLQRQNIDYSPCILQYAKALERILYQRYFKDFVESLNVLEDVSSLLVEDMKDRNTRYLAQQIISGANNKIITIRNMVYLLKALGKPNQSYVLSKYKDFLLSKNIRVLTDEQMDIIDNITQNLRNKAAHPEIMDLVQAKEARQVIPACINSLL